VPAEGTAGTPCPTPISFRNTLPGARPGAPTESALALSDHVLEALLPQQNRLFSLHGPDPAAGLLLDRFTGTEAVSAPFQFNLHLLSERGDLDTQAFLGQPMRVALRTSGGDERNFHGHVIAFRHAGTDGGLARYQATLGPWTRFLGHRRDSRLFQARSVPDILREVFAGYGVLARAEFRIRDADYPPIPLCVQYGESDFQFVSRLLEAHGIFYHYRFEPDGHVLVLADDSRQAPALPGLAGIAYNHLPGASREDTIDSWAAAHRLIPTAVATKTFDFKSPRDPMDARDSTRVASGALPAMEDYAPGGAYAYPDLEAGAELARRRMEAHEAGFETCSGTSNCRALTCGASFELQDHFRYGPGGQDPRFFLTRVCHEGRNNHLDQAGPADYRNRFHCIPKLVRYRPPLRTPRPRTHGPQTALVTGPPGEEIFCDRYGRVKVQFHWDRMGRHDDASSCWVRVSTPWAGSRFGFIAVPRVGQEVVVEFLDGDPDRPLVTGQVYNELKMPPWELPRERTQSGLLTRSSAAGTAEHANALRFEDRKGAEEVWLHAEKDQRIEVEHDERHEVGHDRAKAVGNDETTRIGHDRTEQVGHDETLTVGNDRREAISGYETLTVGRDRAEQVGGDEQISVGANQQVSVAAAHTLTVGTLQTILVGAAKTETVGLASTEQVGGLRSLAVGGSYVVNVNEGKSETVGKGSRQTVREDKVTEVGKVYRIEAGEKLEITVGKAQLVMTKDGKITLAGAELTLEGEGPVKVLGKNVEIN